MKSKVVWIRNDGAVRIVFMHPDRLVVENTGFNAMGEKYWSFAEMGREENLEAFALALMDLPLPKDNGLAGKIKSKRELKMFKERMLKHAIGVWGYRPEDAEVVVQRIIDRHDAPMALYEAGFEDGAAQALHHLTNEPKRA